MKKYIPLFIVSLLAVVAIYFYTQQHQPWYGRCVFGPTSEVSLEFIVLGDTVYLDRNIDGKPQADELLPESGKLDVPANDGPSRYWIGGIGTFPPNATQQVLDLRNVTGADFPFAMNGLLVLSRERSAAETCHLFGPLAIRVCSSENYPPDSLFRPANEAVIKIVLMTENENSTLTSDWGPTCATVYTSVENDRKKCAFDSTVRPELEIVFETTTTPVKQKLTIEEFC
jgi:hypothetical protein